MTRPHEVHREAASPGGMGGGSVGGGGMGGGVDASPESSPGAAPCGDPERRIRVLETRLKVSDAERDELARACEDARNAQGDAEAALRAAEDVLAVVTHDLRNALGTIVMGATALLGGAPADPDRVRSVAERIHRQAERMTQQVVNLGDYSVVQGGRLTIARARQAPSAIVAEASSVGGPLARERGIVFEVHGAADLPEIECDAERVIQALTNLIANAVRVTPRGGTIVLGAMPADRGGLVFFVRDTGPGLPPEELETLFGPRWRSKIAGYRGTGLGFAIARGVVVAHGGRIWADSAPGAGTSVYFSLTPAAG